MPESLFNKVAGLMPATLLKKRLWHSCFLVHVVKFLRTPFSQNTSGRLLLDHFFFFSVVSHAVVILLSYLIVFSVLVAYVVLKNGY